MLKKFAFYSILIIPVVTLYAQTATGVIENWLVLGTFPCDTIHLALEKPFFFDEVRARPEAGTGDTAGGRLWTSERSAESGELNFLDMAFPRSEYCVVYAATYLYVPTERTALLLLGSDDGIAVWLNGQRVHANVVFRGLTRAEDRVPVRLSAGWNILLFKVFNGSGGFGLIAEMVDAHGRPMEDAVFTAERPQNMNPRTTSPYAFITRISLGASYQQGNRRLYPFELLIKNLGKSGTYPGHMTIRSDDRLSKTVAFELTTQQTIIVPLSAGEVKELLGREVYVHITLAGEVSGKQSFTMTPEMVWSSLFKAENLPVEIAVSKTLFENLEENAAWYEKFTGSTIPGLKQSLTAAVDHALEENWIAFFNTLKPNFEKLEHFSADIKQDTLHMIGQSHIDMAWLWRWPETIEVCRKTFRSGLDFFEEEPGFRYIQSQAACFLWLEERYPDLFRDIQTAVKNEQFFVVGGMWVEPDLNLIGGEALVRQFLYGKRYFREKFGVDCVTGYTPDTFGYTWTLPQILKKCGFKYFVTTKIRWNDTTTFPYSLFKWTSADGSEILTCFPMSLNSACEPVTEAENLQVFKREGLTDMPILFGVGDHGGGPTRQHFANIKKMQQLAVYPTVLFDDLDSYMEKVEKKYPDVPVHKDELYLEYHRGTLTTQGEVKKQNRRAEVALEEAEKLAVFSGIGGWDQLEKAWRLTLFNQFHDILPGSSIPEVYIDAQKDYCEISAITDSIITRSLESISDKISLKGKGVPVLVFNPLSWDRTDIVTVDLKQTRSIKQVIGCDGQKVPFQQEGSELVFVAPGIPSCGYKVFWLRSGQPKKQKMLRVDENSLENDYFRIDINPKNGNIRSFVDKRLNIQVIAENHEGNVLQFFEDKPAQYDAWNIGYTGTSYTCDEIKEKRILENGPARASLRVVRPFNNSVFTQDYVIYAGIPRLDIRTRVDWHEQHILAKAAFPVNVTSDFATYEIAYGTIRRTTDPRTPVEKAKFEVSAHKFVDLSQASYGVALLNDSKYGHDISGFTMRLTLLRSPITPDPLERPPGYQNPYADQGEHEFTYSIYPHRGDCANGHSLRSGYELNYPLLSTLCESHKGVLKPRQSFLTVKPDNLVLTVVKRAEENGDTVLRLYEVNGQRAEAKLTLQRPISKAWEVDMLEHRIKPLEIQKNTVMFTVNPHEIFSIAIE